MAVRLDRRQFVSAAGAAFVAGLARPAREALADEEELFAAAYMNRDKSYGLAVLTGKGRIVSSETLPGRGHGFAATREWIVAFARRPGVFALAIRRDRAEAPRLIAAQEGRHFFGHGLFSADGKLLYATENDYEGERGVIGVYDATSGFGRIGEFPSGGVDPHDMTMLEGGRVLCVANGGILTHPDFGRAKLNLATMEPAIAFIRLPEGEMVERHALPADLSRLSLRHMAADASGRVWIGGQWEGEANETPALAWRCRRGEDLSELPAPPDGWAPMRNYVGSVAASLDGATIAFTAPQGNRVLVADAASGASLWREKERVYGVAGGQDGLLLTTETGEAGPSRHDLAWDNHVLRLP